MIDESVQTQESFFDYYRRLRPEKFSDTVVSYEIPLTKELFEKQIENLSVNNKHDEFQNFIRRVAMRLITPNIKPQTGPDGGGDGKIDGETYEVASEVSNKWYVADGGCCGSEKWAIAISCKKQWKPKVYSDVEKIAGTGRGYTKILFFSNQNIKASTRINVENELRDKYGIVVSIFDGKWCEQAVFDLGCKEIALEELNFSDEYKKKKVIKGTNDLRREKRLKALEEDILTRQIEGLDTQYIDDLLEINVLSRSLELPRIETEGRFQRSMRECEHYGTTQQMFNIIYEHGWTSFFWFRDVDATYKDYLKLKGFVEDNCTMPRVEKFTNLLTNLVNATNVGLFDETFLHPEIEYLEQLKERIKSVPNKQSCLLFLELYFIEHRIIGHLQSGESIDDDLDVIAPLIKESAHHTDISFDAQYRIMEIIGRCVENNPKYERLVDELAAELSKRKSEVEGAQIHLMRGQQHINKKNNKQAIRQFGFCLNAFEKEGCETELIRSNGLMGMALYEEGLPYSAEAHFVKAASILVRDFYTTGNIPHLLLTILDKLCEIELMLGRLVMFLNWRELLHVLANNGGEILSRDFEERDFLFDCSWSCRFADSNLETPAFSILPDILERQALFMSTEYH